MGTKLGLLPRLINVYVELCGKLKQRCLQWFGPLKEPEPTEGFVMRTLAPSNQQTSVTLQQRAAIALKIPNSGLDWLDEMIKQSRQLDIEDAKKAAKGDAA